MITKKQQITGGLAQAGVYRRGKCSGKLNVCVPSFNPNVNNEKKYVTC